MAQRSVIDLFVIGADAAGIAAAACAARVGAKVATAATGGERAEDGFVEEPPNFVWRLLELHRHDLRFDEPASDTTLISARSSVTTGADCRRTAEGLAERDAALEHLWPQFFDAMTLSAARPAGDRNLMTPSKFASANDALDSYFDDEALKTHLVSVLVSPFGLGGDEAGSAEALLSAAGWGRRRTLRRALVDALRSAAVAAGAELCDSRLASLARADNKYWNVSLQDGREFRAREIMASSVLVGEAAGLRVTADRTPLFRRAGAEATINLRYDKRPKLSGKNSRARYHTASDRQQIARARMAMTEGRIPDQAPLTIEFVGKNVIARAPYCPARLKENGGFREWTGQDRQILSRQVVDQIERLFGDIGSAREIEVTIGQDVASGLRRRVFSTPPIAAPAPSHDEVGAAAALAMEIVRRD